MNQILLALFTMEELFHTIDAMAKCKAHKVNDNVMEFYVHF